MSDENDMSQEATSKESAALDAVRAYRRSPPTLPAAPIERIVWLSPDNVVCTRNANGGVTAWSREDAKVLRDRLTAELDEQFEVMNEEDDAAEKAARP